MSSKHSYSPCVSELFEARGFGGFRAQVDWRECYGAGVWGDGVRRLRRLTLWARGSPPVCLVSLG